METKLESLDLKTSMTSEEVVELFQSIHLNIMKKFFSKDLNTAADSQNEEDEEEDKNNSDISSIEKQPTIWIQDKIIEAYPENQENMINQDNHPLNNNNQEQNKNRKLNQLFRELKDLIEQDIF